MAHPPSDAPSDTVSVFIVDNNLRRNVWEANLDGVLSEGGRRFTIFDEVVPTAAQARATLEWVIEQRTPPDLIVIDHELNGYRDGSTELIRESGLGLMRWLSAACEAADQLTPKAVLWSALYHRERNPGLAYAFMEAGGTNAFQGNRPTFVEELWSVVDDGARWTHTVSRKRLELVPAVARLLPYLEANWDTEAIGRELARLGHITSANPRARVNHLRGQLVTACNELSFELYGTKPFGRGQSVALARFALEHGLIWIPLRYRDPDA